MRRVIAISILHLIALRCVEANEPRSLKWSELQTLAGSRVEVSFDDGSVVWGPLMAVATSALTIEVEKLSGPQAPVKGPLSIGRDRIQQLRVQHMRKRGRIIGTVVGAVGGLAAGGAAAVYLTDPFKSKGSGTRTGAVFCGVTAGVLAAGYYVGRSTDRRWTTVVIVP